MSDQKDWLDETWEIKRRLAERFAGVRASEQVKSMRESVLREWKKRGWELVEGSPGKLPSGK